MSIQVFNGLPVHFLTPLRAKLHGFGKVLAPFRVPDRLSPGATRRNTKSLGLHLLHHGSILLIPGHLVCRGAHAKNIARRPPPANRISAPPPPGCEFVIHHSDFVISPPMTLHHFRKEFRYLRIRWFAFLALLGFDLAVNLEWLLPMRAGVASPGWLGYLPVAALLGGLSLLLSCPEDRPGTDRSFISTRPLPAGAYWAARVLIWLLLIVLPVVLQNGLYLAISHRPAGDVLRGMWERFCFAAGFSAWLLPALVLWNRRELWKALLMVALGLVVASKTLDIVAASWRFYPSIYQKWPGLAAGWSVFGVLSAWIAWKHLKMGWRFRRRLLATGVVAVLGLLTARFWVLLSPELAAQNEALVKRLAPQLQMDIPISTTYFDGSDRGFGQKLTGSPLVSTGQQGVHVDTRVIRTHVEQAGMQPGKDVPASIVDLPRFSWNFLQSQVQRGDEHLRGFFPEGTLFFSSAQFPTWSREEMPTTLASFAAPYPDVDKPLRVTSEFRLDWHQRDLAIELPGVVGSQGECEDVRWKILGITPATGPQPGALSVSLHVETRAHWDAENGFAILLHSPQRQMVWLDPVKQTPLGARAGHTGWLRSQMDLTWSNIFNHADGAATGVDAASLRLILLRSRYLGRSEQTWKSPEIRLADIPHPWGKDIQWTESRILYAGRELKSFQERMATVKPPSAESTEQEARRYVYDLFSAASVTQAVYTPAAHPLIAQAFETLGRHHLPLMLDLRSQTWPGWSNRPPNNQLERYVTDDQREVLIDRALQSTGLASLVVSKGWAEAARRLKPQVLSMHHLPRAAQTLLMAWKDEESNARLMREIPYDTNGFIAEDLDKDPALRPQVEAAVRQQMRTVLPMAGSQHQDAIFKLMRAANFGSVEALDLCLRWQAIGGDEPPRNSGQPFPKLLAADGSDFWKKRMPDHERWSLFRRLKVSDFEYLPEKRAWKFRQP